jgi:hypothetical protein
MCHFINVQTHFLFWDKHIKVQYFFFSFWLLQYIKSQWSKWMEKNIQAEVHYSLRNSVHIFSFKWVAMKGAYSKWWTRIAQSIKWLAVGWMTRILFLVGAGIVFSHNFHDGSWACQVSGHFYPGEKWREFKGDCSSPSSAEAPYAILYMK